MTSAKKPQLLQLKSARIVNKIVYLICALPFKIFSKIFQLVFERSLLCSPRPHLFDQNYSNMMYINMNIVIIIVIV